MPVKILVVDDEPDLEQLIRQKFRRAIRDAQFEFLFARSGVDAIAQLTADGDVDLVLTDINMPEMDGLTLLGKIDELNAQAMKSVVVSAYGDMDNIRVAMNRGAFDFVTKPIDLEDLEKTIAKALRETSMIKDALRTRDTLIAIQRDLNIASEIQMSMLPTGLNGLSDRSGFEIAATMIPAREVGGDLYDYFPIDENRIGIVIGDVSGKGVPAALLMAISRTLMRSAGREKLPVTECLTGINAVLAEETLPHMFVTMFYGILDTQTGRLEYCSGGHNPPYHVTATGQVTPLAGPGGLPIGMMTGFPYEMSELTLSVGDTVFLYTDGVTEAPNVAGEEYGEERLQLLLGASCTSPVSDLVNQVVDAVQQFSTGVPQADDITCLALRRPVT